MNDSMAYASDVKFAIFTFYTAMGLILFPIGFLLLVKDRTYLLLFFCLLPIGLLHFMFRNTGCATKHYLYLIPFVIPMTARTLQAIFDLKSKKLKLGIYSCIFLFLICSIRIDIQGSPWRNKIDSEAQLGPFIKLCSENRTRLHARLSIGAGQLIPTLDEFMLASGNAFYPFYISTYKIRKDKLRREAYEILKDKDYKLLMLPLGDKSWFVNLLLEDGWKMVLNKENVREQLGHLVKNGKSIGCYYNREIQKNDHENMMKVLNRYQGKKPIWVVEELENVNYLLDFASFRGD